MTTKIAIIGSGNIGTDLLIKCIRGYDRLKPVAMVGIDPDSDGLARARRLGVATTDKGVAGLIAMPGFDDVDIILDATSAKAHLANAEAHEDTSAVLSSSSRAALVTVTKYTAQGSAESAESSSDLILARRDDRLHVFGRSQENPATLIPRQQPSCFPRHLRDGQG